MAKKLIWVEIHKKGKDVTARCHAFFSNAEVCPIVFNVLENANDEFSEDMYAFENPD